MNKIIKKMLASLICLTMVLSLGACGGSSTDKSTDTSKETSTTDEKVTLDVWHVWTTDGDGNSLSFQEALAEYEAEHPDVTVNVSATENEAYKTKIKTAISANEAPDVFFTWGAGFAKPFVDSGSIAVITDYLEEGAIDNLKMSTTSNFTYDEKLYGLPFISWVAILYCNEELFNEAGVKVPDTMDELYTAIEAFNKKGITPISVGAKDAWNAMFFQNAANIRTAGVEASTDALNKVASYDQPEFVAGAQMVLDLVGAGAFDPACLALTYDEAKISFYMGESAMMYQGSWQAAEIQNPEMSNIADKVVAKNFPAIDGGQYNNQFLGGAIDGFMVSESCEHKEIAAEFVAYITERMSKKSFLAGAGLPVWNIDVTDEEVDPLVDQILDLVDDSEGYIVAWDTYLSGSDVTTHLSLVQEMFAEVKTAEEFVSGMQELNE
jgi:raffinose/stachyose/melibiose transport system substrate-binding protein